MLAYNGHHPAKFIPRAHARAARTTGLWAAPSRATAREALYAVAAASTAGAAARGNVTVNVDPRPGSLATVS
jgi:hypothetical protein